MTSRRSNSTVVGPTQSPDIVLEHLQRTVIEKLDAQIVLEGALVESALLCGADAGSVRLERVYLKDVDLSDTKLRAIHLTDVIAKRIDAANGDWNGGRLRCAHFEDARLTGLNASEASIEEVLFKDCKLDYMNFRHSTIRHVLFEDCSLRGSDFQGAKIEATRFANCRLVETDFSNAQISSVDLRGSELALAGSVLALRGATINSLQLIELARMLALELGITVDDA